MLRVNNKRRLRGANATKHTDPDTSISPSIDATANSQYDAKTGSVQYRCVHSMMAKRARSLASAAPILRRHHRKPDAKVKGFLRAGDISTRPPFRTSQRDQDTSLPEGF